MGTVSEHIHLDFRSQEPIYLQIVSQMEKLVQEKILSPGEQLPTVRQMATELRINFSTVARAYHILDDKKLISTQRGRGTYIWDENDFGEQISESEKQTPGVSGQEQTINQLANIFITDALQAGFTLDEIKFALNQEIAGRKM